MASMIGFACFKSTFFAPESIVGGFLIFITFTMGSVTKDLEDYEGDKKAGIQTVFTVFGLKKGMRITQLFLFITFLSPMVMLHQLIDIVAFPFFATLGVLLFGKLRKYNVMLALFFVVLAYCGFRVIRVIN